MADGGPADGRVLPVPVRPGQPARGGPAVGLGDHRVEVVLGQAGLAERAGDALVGYSYGMRQRLGGAAAAGSPCPL